MRSRFPKGMLAVALMSLAVAVMAAGGHWAQSPAANPSDQEREKRNVRDEVLTVIDAAAEEMDIHKKAARTKKNKQFNRRKSYASEELRDGELFGTILESPPPPPLPVNVELIVVGGIHRRQPYVSDDRTNVYTELTVHIEDILKNNTSSPVYAFEPLTVNRAGGAIRMPNGHVFRYFVAGVGSMPEVGKRYVLFLQHDAERGYNLIVGYELADKTIRPLEDFPDRDPIVELTEVQFFDLLRLKISQSLREDN